MGYQNHGKRIREFFNHKANVLQNQYEIIEKLLPVPVAKKEPHIKQKKEDTLRVLLDRSLILYFLKN